MLFVLVLVLLFTATSVFAAGGSYYFEVRPSVQTLPLFSPDGFDGTAAVYEGFLHEGVYDVFGYVASFGEFALPEPFVISYSPLSDYDGWLGCQLNFLLTVSGVDYSFRADIVYFESANSTILLLFGGDTSIPFSEGDRILFVEAGSESGSNSSDVLLKDLIVDLFGPYEPQTETITQSLSDGSTVTVEQRIPGIAGLDYEWFAALCLFGLMLYCFFRLLGGVFK